MVEAPAGSLVTGVDSKQRAGEGPMARNRAGEAKGKQGGWGGSFGSPLAAGGMVDGAWGVAEGRPAASGRLVRAARDGIGERVLLG